MSDLIFNLLILALVGGVAGYTAGLFGIGGGAVMVPALFFAFRSLDVDPTIVMHCAVATSASVIIFNGCLLYTSPSPRDGLLSRMPSSA